jgi:hypothetical protein
MTKIVQIGEGAFFVTSYSEQTITRSYTVDTTVQSFGYGGTDDERNVRAIIDDFPQLPGIISVDRTRSAPA